MSLEQVFFRTWRVASFPIVVIVLLICYYTLPDNVAIHHNGFGKPDGFVSKETFFYVVGGIILVFNVLMRALKEVIMKLPDSAFPQQNTWIKNRGALNQTIDAWISLFVALVNTYIIICLIGLSRVNRNDEQLLDMNYNWVLLLGGVLLMVIIFYLPLKLLYTKPKEES